MAVRRTIYKSLLSSLIVVLTPFLVLVGSMAQDSSFATQALAVDLADISWGPPGGGNGVPMGVRTARQGIDPATGGVTYYAMFPAGSHFDLHWHTHDEFVVVVQGTVTIELGEETYSLELGSYVVIPGRMNHSWDVPEGDDVVILVRRAGPADFNFVGK
ncbi:MAG: cupin domain-containing protein [Pseudomonadales bacterium]|nr:cupin domain-containing protein [Pseudomonadales bacterium]